MTNTLKEVDYEQPQAAGDGGVCATKHAWARVPVEPSPAERAALKDQIRRLLKEKTRSWCRTTTCTPTCKTWPKKPAGW